MKFHGIIGALLMGTALFADPVDQELFLNAHLSDLTGKVVFQGGQALLPEQKNSFEHALSVNIGKNLPSAVYVVSKDATQVTGLSAHIQDIADSLKVGGKAIITAPASYDVVFTDNTVSADVAAADIAAALKRIGSSQDTALIAKTLGGLQSVTRATFVSRGGKLTLVTKEKSLMNGEKIWRKTPEGVELNAYHSEEEFLSAIASAKLTCEEVKRPCFFGQVKWQAYNASLKNGQKGLGSAYQDHNPYTIYYVTKKA